MAVAEKLSNSYIGPAPRHLSRRILSERRDQVEKALSYTFGLYQFDDVVDAIEEGDMQLWNVIENGAVKGIEITELTIYPRGKVCNLFLTVGVGLSSWGPKMLEIIEEFAKEKGCAMMTGRGRKGWVKLAKNYGFTGEFMSSVKVL